MSTNLSRGLVTSIPERYVQFALFNLKKIYGDLGCQLPIEIWEVGNELSAESKQKINAITDKIIWRNVSEFTSDLGHWKGFQVKAFIVANSSFNEVLLFDADGIFHQNPENLFSDAGYQDTGFYLFRDLKRWVFEFNWYDKLMYQLGLRKPFKGNKFRNYAFYQQRQAWLRRCLNHQKPSNFPIEWDYIWKDGIPAETCSQVLHSLQITGKDFMDASAVPSTKFLYSALALGTNSALGLGSPLADLIEG
jgi:hypothetical protein